MGHRALIKTICILAVLLLGCACAAPAMIPAHGQLMAEETLLMDLHAQYRGASLIVSGTCESSHIDAAGQLCNDIKVAEVFAGAAKPGETLHCYSLAMQQGETYLLFLSGRGDVYHAEDTPGYEAAADSALRIDGAATQWNGNQIALDLLREELRELNDIVNAPAPTYFYDSLDALISAADEIFIGAVREVPAMENMEFIIRNGGSVEKALHQAAIVRVEAYGSIKGALSYGQTVDLVYSPDQAAETVNAKNLQPGGYGRGNASTLRGGGIYLFFLVSGPDEKQPYLFPVNPIQGFLELRGEDLVVNPSNTPFIHYDKLTSLVIAIQGDLRQEKEPAQNPQLIVEGE